MTLKLTEAIGGSAALKPAKELHAKRSLSGAQHRTSLEMAGASYTEGFLLGQKRKQVKKLLELVIRDATIRSHR
jgi:hypothetical protein